MGIEQAYNGIDQNELKDQQFIDGLKKLDKNQKIDLAGKVDSGVSDSARNIIRGIDEQIRSKGLDTQPDFIEKTLGLVNSLSQEQKANLKLMLAVWEIKRMNNVDGVSIDLSNLNFVESDLKNMLGFINTFGFDISKEKRIDWGENAKTGSVLDFFNKTGTNLDAGVSFDSIYNKFVKDNHIPDFDSNIIGNRVILRDNNGKDLGIRLKAGDKLQVVAGANFVPVEHDGRKDYYLTVKIPGKEGTFKVSANFINMPKSILEMFDKVTNEQSGKDLPNSSNTVKDGPVEPFVAPDVTKEGTIVSPNSSNTVKDGPVEPSIAPDTAKEGIDKFSGNIVNLYKRISDVMRNKPTNDNIDKAELPNSNIMRASPMGENEAREVIRKQIDEILSKNINLVERSGYVHTMINGKHINDIIKEEAINKGIRFN